MNIVRNKDKMRRGNTRLVLQEIFDSKFTTRAQIARNLGLNKSTVSSIYEELKQIGVVEEIGEGAASNVGGRKPTNIRVNRKYGFTMSFDISYRNLHYIVNYLDSSVIVQDEIGIFGENIATVIATIKNTVRDFQNQVSSENGLLGICLSIHGTVNDQNKVTYSPFIDMVGMDIDRQLEIAFDVPVVLENESNLTAIYVRDFLPKQSTLDGNVVAISIHKGIGSGIIIDNKLFRGINGSSGEVGQTLTKDSNGSLTTIESICSEDALINTVDSQLNRDDLNRYSVVEMYRQKNEVVVNAVEGFITEIAELAYNTTMMFDTSRVYIGSPLMEIAPEILPRVANLISTIGKKQIELIQIKNADRATLLGACSLITHDILGMTDYDLKIY